jgi:hypothetical protein
MSRKIYIIETMTKSIDGSTFTALEEAFTSRQKALASIEWRRDYTKRREADGNMKLIEWDQKEDEALVSYPNNEHYEWKHYTIRTMELS